MSATGIPSTAGLISRVQNILLKPAAEWEVIAGESATTQSLLINYVCVLAVLPAIGSLIAKVLIGGLFGGGLGMGAALVGGLVSAILGYALTVGVTFAAGLIINALASSFGAKPDPTQALKVAVYSSTPAWVAGIVSWIPILGGLLVLAAICYGFYLLYLGLMKLMQPPADKAVIYTVVVVVVEAVLFGIVFWITALVVGMLAVGAVATGAATLGGVR